MQVLEAASRGYLQRLHDPKRGESQKAKREEYVERKSAAVIVQGHMRKRLAADEWQMRRSAAAHMQACYRGRRDRETVATHQEGREELKAASEAAAAAEKAAMEAERAAKEAAAQARCNIVSDLDAENAAEHAMVAKAAAAAAATHLTEVEAKLAAATSSGDGGGGGAGVKLARPRSSASLDSSSSLCAHSVPWAAPASSACFRAIPAAARCWWPPRLIL